MMLIARTTLVLIKIIHLRYKFLAVSSRNTDIFVQRGGFIMLPSFGQIWRLWVNNIEYSDENYDEKKSEVKKMAFLT